MLAIDANKIICRIYLEMRTDYSAKKEAFSGEIQVGSRGAEANLALVDVISGQYSNGNRQFDLLRDGTLASFTKNVLGTSASIEVLQRDGAIERIALAGLCGCGRGNSAAFDLTEVGKVTMQSSLYGSHEWSVLDNDQVALARAEIAEVFEAMLK